VKNFTLFIILIAFVLTACSAPATPTSVPTLPPPTTTNALISHPTETPIPPTATLEPSPTSVPLGGGGKFIMKVNPLLIPKEFNAQKPANWFSASADGTNLKLFDWQIWSLSPDGKRALTYTGDDPNYKVTLRTLDGTSAIPLDDSVSYYILPRDQTAVWLPNGNVVLLAIEPKQRTKISAYIVSPDGKLTKWVKLSQSMNKFAWLLFVSPDGKNLYWAMYGKTAEIFVTSLDDSQQKRILYNVYSFQDISISPSGQFIVFLDNSNLVLHGCFIYNVADGTTTKITPDDKAKGLGYCFSGDRGTHWSPTEDKLFGQNSDGFSVLNVLDGKITTFPEINAGSCYSVNWTPDGKNLFLSVCTKENSYKQYGNGGGVISEYYSKFVPSIGARLINISTGKVTEYPDAGFCKTAISPDSKWVLFYLCRNEDNIVANPSQLLNLDTKEVVPLLEGFISDDPKATNKSNDDLYKGWSVFWVP